MTLSKPALAVLFIIASSLVSISSFAESTPVAGPAPAGFYGGNDFEFTSAVGEVFVDCPQQPGYPPRGPQTAYFRCMGYIFAPTEAAGFRGAAGDFDEVELVATHEDGSTTKLTSAYDGSRGRSIRSFNLWVETAFQPALLRLGRNIVDWTLMKRGQAVAMGTFFSHVVQKRDLRCPSVSQTSWDPYNCVQSSRVCSEYYRMYGNQCR